MISLNDINDRDINDKESIQKDVESISFPENNPNEFGSKIKQFIQKHKSAMDLGMKCALHVVILGYVAYATYYFLEKRNSYFHNSVENNGTEQCSAYCEMKWCDGYGLLLILVSLVYIGLLYYLLIGTKLAQSAHESLIGPFQNKFLRISSTRYFKVGTIMGILIIISVFLAIDTVGSRHRLRSLIGIFTMMAFGYIFSKHRKKIKYRPVISGFALQFLLGIICIRWSVGRQIFECLGGKFESLLDFTKYGGEFVYGHLLVRREAAFAFTALPLLFVFSMIISVLYYLEWMQKIVQKCGWCLQAVLGTTVCESVVCAANVFVGMSESPLLVSPYLKYLTYSEIHTIIGSGLAMTAGTVLGAYISFGADPAHLIASCVMSAPGALAFSKLFYPETEDSLTSTDNIEMEKSSESSVLHAAANGVAKAIPLVEAIIANVIAFIAIIALLNAIVNWFGWLVGYSDVTFELIFTTFFTPIAWIIGIPWEDCENIAAVIATKTTLNEFVAFEKLGSMEKEKRISLRSFSIATYAICGFANPGSIGVVLASYSSLCPEKSEVFVAVVLRAFVTGTVVCFITASVAGLLID